MSKVSVLTATERKYLQTKILDLRVGQVLSLREDTLLDEFLRLVALNSPLIALKEKNALILWDEKNGFTLDIEESLLRDSEFILKAFRAIRKTFVEPFLDEIGDPDDLKENNLVKQEEKSSLLFEAKPEEENTQIAQIEQEENTQIAQIEQEEDAQVAQAEQEEDAQVAQIEQEEDTQVAQAEQEEDAQVAQIEQEEDTQVAQVEQEEEPDFSNSQKSSPLGSLDLAAESSENIDDILSQAQELIDSMKGLANQEEEMDFSGFDESEMTESETNQKILDSKEEEDLLSLVGKLDETTLSGNEDLSDADEFSNLDLKDEENSHIEENSQNSEIETNDTEDLLSMIGELDEKTLASTDEEITADEFSNLSESQEEILFSEEEENDHPAITEKVVKSEIKTEPKVIAKKAKPQEPVNEIEALRQELLATGMEEFKINSLMKAVESKKATPQMVRQTVQAMLNEE